MLVARTSPNRPSTRRLVAGLAAAALVLGLTGCASTAQLHVWRPAELDVPELHRLVVLDFNSSDETGETVRSAVVAELSESRFFDLIDQAELGPVVVTDGPSRGKIDLAAAIDAGRRLGIDALLTGDVVSYHVTDSVVRQSSMDWKGDRSKRPGAGPEFFLQQDVGVKREAVVSLDFRLVDVRSGQICASRQVVHTYRKRPGDRPAPPLSRDEVLADLLRQCAHDILAKIAPHQEPCEVKLATAWYGSAAAEIRRGNGYAVAGDWEEASRCYREALEKDPDSHAAHYNLALAHEARCEYGPAGELLAKARESHSSDLYAEAQQRVQRSDEAYRVVWLQRLQQASRTPDPMPLR